MVCCEVNERPWGKGSEVPGGGPGSAADLVIVIAEKPHDVYTRDGDDLVSRCNITVQQALCGFKLTLVRRCELNSFDPWIRKARGFKSFKMLN